MEESSRSGVILKVGLAGAIALHPPDSSNRTVVTPTRDNGEIRITALALASLNR
jgi:hypothetical protein